MLHGDGIVPDGVVDDRRIPAEHRIQHVHAVRLPCGQPVEFDAAVLGEPVQGVGQFTRPVDAVAADRQTRLHVAVQVERASGIVKGFARIVVLQPLRVVHAAAAQYLVVGERVQHAVEIRVYDRDAHVYSFPVSGQWSNHSIRRSTFASSRPPTAEIDKTCAASITR